MRQLPPIKCKVCGKEFIPRNGQSKVCGYECRIINQKQMHKAYRDRMYKEKVYTKPKKEPKPEPKVKPKSLAQLQNEAKEMGLTYGQYQLLKWKEQRDENRSSVL